MNNILLSIIIPTRNRQIYCIEAIKSILFDLDERCEIIVQDNSDDKILEELIRELNDNRIVYSYSSKPLSFVDNFEKALMLSSGEYFCILGDDDSITKDIIKITEWMKSKDIESIACNTVVDYIWPYDKIPAYKTGLLKIPNYNGEVYKIDVRQQLEALIKNGFLAYQTFNLPRTYHGIVKRSLMDKVKEKSGRYFSGLTPDIYSTVTLACVAKEHFIINYPFSIAGGCPTSATVQATVGGHSGKLEDAPHFKNRGEYTWERTIPSYYSVETIWAETAIKALKDMQEITLLKEFNKYKLYLYGVFLNRKYIPILTLKETFKLKKQNKEPFFYLGLLKESLYFAWNLINKKILSAKQNKTIKSQEFCAIPNLIAAKNKLYTYLPKKSFDEISL